MLVRFWGTRGSLPVAPTAATIRRKIAHALISADGRRFENVADAERFVETELGFAAARVRRGCAIQAAARAAVPRNCIWESAKQIPWKSVGIDVM